MNYWILITNIHDGDTWILPEGDEYPYEIAPNSDIKRGDTVYLWWNPHSEFYGWGEVIETPRTILVDRPAPDGGIERIKRTSLLVRRQGGLYPHITALDMYRDRNLRNFIPTGQDDLYALPLRPGQAFYLNDYIREHNRPAPVGSTSISWLAQENAPEITVQAIITPEPIIIPSGEILTLGPKTSEGRLVDDVSVVWDELIRSFVRNPEEIYDVDPRKLEEIVAGAYKIHGYEVELTPRSGDRGRDVVATKHGVGSIRIFDQIKRYKISRPVSADEVRSLLGTITAAPNVSKGVITTTSTFAPRLLDDDDIRRQVPHRLELKPKDVLLKWLQEARRR
jgi:restriction system protein